MTPVPERPDYSSVPEMYCIDITFEERREVYLYLIKLQVPSHEGCDAGYRHYPNLAWEEFEGECQLYGATQNIDPQKYKVVSRDEFKAPFAAIHKEWEEAINKRPTVLERFNEEFHTKPTLLVPIEKEIELNNVANMKLEAKGFNEGARWMRDKIIELNK